MPFFLCRQQVGSTLLSLMYRQVPASRQLPHSLGAVLSLQKNKLLEPSWSDNKIVSLIGLK